MQIDPYVLAIIATGTVVFLWLLHRRGARGRGLVTGTWLGFHGLALVASLAAHCIDIVGRLFVGTGHNAAPFPYDFHAYSLLLFGVVQILLGGVLLREAPRLSRSEIGARARAGAVALAALLTVAPLIPIHRFFGVPFTALALVSLAAVLLAVPSGHTGRMSGVAA